MSKTKPVSIRHCFADVPDPRRKHMRLHNLWDIFAITILGVIAGAVEEDPLVRDLGGRAEVAVTVRERDALNVLDVFQQRLEIISDLHPFVTGEVTGLGPIMGVTHRGFSIGAELLRRREPPQLLLKGLRRLLLFPPYWGMLWVEPLLDELLDLPSGNIELTGNRGPDHRDLPILPGGGKLGIYQPRHPRPPHVSG